MTTERRDSRTSRRSSRFGHRILSRVAALFLLLGLAILSCGPPLDRDCPHGDLDPRYCDRDGDLVADTPD
ncbi:MAG: hypothetical protein R3223_11125, partial [Longimicrobiales bacterium]|nr:hypothetical protein [Longimicrobiales bacterium]